MRLLSRPFFTFPACTQLQTTLLPRITASSSSTLREILIATAVKITPLQSAGELIRNVQNSPTKEIDAALRQSVVRLVRKERREINTVLLEGAAVDNTVGSLAKLSDALWFCDAVRKHMAGECLDVFKVYIVGRQIMEEDRTVFLPFANVWNLLNMAEILPRRVAGTHQRMSDACDSNCSRQRFSQDPLRQHGALRGVLRIRLSYHAMHLCQRG